MTWIAYHAPGAPNLHPADARLSLPDRLYSFPLQRLVIHEAAVLVVVRVRRSLKG
ncbi:hypothetical protein [Allorhizocola rhizosphaerae]|uniref:hypothetical protein n=1 Tax=Allorhizocola rhizosphaerae TaxID=1872709 RepID=UPI0013C2DF5D|nr:hypothetical protein [Allorhizocola rhizosphaerae]